MNVLVLTTLVWEEYATMEATDVVKVQYQGIDRDTASDSKSETVTSSVGNGAPTDCSKTQLEQLIVAAV